MLVADSRDADSDDIGTPAMRKRRQVRFALSHIAVPHCKRIADKEDASALSLRRRSQVLSGLEGTVPRPEDEQVAVPVAAPVAETVRNKLHRVEAHFDDLQSCYFSCRRNGMFARWMYWSIAALLV